MGLFFVFLLSLADLGNRGRHLRKSLKRWLLSIVQR
jgi:hypothetical protein